MVEQNAEYGWLTGGEATRLKHIRERLAAYRPDPTSPSTNRAVDDMRFTADLANRLARELADQRATEAVLRGEIRRSESALAAFDRVVEERDAARAKIPDLIARMQQACSSLAELAQRPTNTFTDQHRLLAKRDGVGLALSYVEEANRG